MDGGLLGDRTRQRLKSGKPHVILPPRDSLLPSTHPGTFWPGQDPRVRGFGGLRNIGGVIGAAPKTERMGLDAYTAQRFASWILVGAFVTAHLVDRLVYHPMQTLEDPISLILIWEGLSSFGGFLGATIGAAWFIRREALGAKAWGYLDAVGFSFPFGWVLGRTGCFVAFDHPGLPTDFFLSMVDHNGIQRHNLGLNEAIFTLGMAVVFWFLGKKPRFPGFYLSLFIAVYAPFRFAMDYLRIRDVRYFGLTPGQIGCIALSFVAVWIWRRQSAKPAFVVTKKTRKKKVLTGRPHQPKRHPKNAESSRSC